jgi:hypothetical protein
VSATEVEQLGSPQREIRRWWLMATRSAKLHVASARRQASPNGDGERHTFLVRVTDVPPDLPLDPNPRGQKIDRGIYRQVKDSLLANDGSFLWKNHGITILAKKVNKIDDVTYELEMDEGHHGISDGGHTFRIIREAVDENGQSVDQQSVEVRVFTGVVPDVLEAVEVAGALNTTMQVQEMSLANLAGKFDWLKDLLRSESYFDKIAWRENEKAPYDARDLVVFIDMFNVRRFPVNSEEHPTRAYNNKGEVLKDYVKDPVVYERFEPIVKDILTLFDTISLEGPKLHTQHGGRAGKLDFVKVKKPKKSGLTNQFEFHFIGQATDQCLDRAALYPMLGAFRWMIVERSDGKFAWRESFDHVLAVWRKAAPEMMRATQATHAEYRYKLTNLGKSRTHWGTMFNVVARHDLELRAKR